ncbi:glycosyltransferase [Rhodoplanes sp. Z2-YC6860]|uniref:glycosyltransferase n=1 Tax=Rhodoplanes sp. Z2-YC6860 TaxID=674703 RepID=UPI00078BA0CD|nr:glycosyltransferase [Rhodoplanes sp. Z2-YC6860]AMN43208.1 family 2 glycosyl transferase [Rhodoplanes sp. Z2-YC6860]
MTPRVSVVIKSYNHAPFVAQTIQSVLDQSFQDFEIVLTDDASTDGTPDVVRGFTDKRIRLEVSPSNQGVSKAMNATLARARGELIAILNSDDYALPGRLEKQVAFLDGHPDAGAVFTMPQIVDEAGAATDDFSDFHAALKLPDFSRRSWLRQFFFKGNILCGPTAMIRRSCYSACGEYDPRLTNLQDFDMWIRLAVSAPIHVMSEELTAFRIRRDHQNASAPRPDTELRTAFETAQILKRFRSIPIEVLNEAFAQDLVERKIERNSVSDIWLAELALTIPYAAHRLFALETLFETAHSDEAIRRLRNHLGSVDVFGVHEMRRRDLRIRELDNLTDSLNEALRRSRRWTAPLRALKKALRRR